jgi:hypothetical protein
LRDRNEALIEKILIVLGADHFVERYFLLTLIAPVTLNRFPRRRECTGILNVNLDFQSSQYFRCRKATSQRAMPRATLHQRASSAWLRSGSHPNCSTTVFAHWTSVARQPTPPAADRDRAKPK